MKYRFKSEKGQAIVLIALVIVGLVGFTALAVDGGNAYVDKRKAQNAADTAALTSALASIRGSDVYTAGYKMAASNGYDNNGETNTVNIYQPPISGPYTGDNEYIQVVIEAQTEAFFAPIIGIDQTTTQVEAVARAKASQREPLYNGSAIVALSRTGNSTAKFIGGSNLTTIGGGVFVNSDSSSALNFMGAANVESPALVSVGGARFVGGAFIDADITVGEEVHRFGFISVNGTITKNANIPPYTDLPDVPVPQISVPTITCSTNGTYTVSGDTVHLTPGNHPARHISGLYTTVTMDPGNYCFSGNLSFGGSIGTINANNVAINMGSNTMTANGNFTLNAENSHFNFSSGNLFLNGLLTFNATNSQIYLDTGNFIIQGYAEPAFSNTTVYMESGNLRFIGMTHATINSTEPSVFYLGTGTLLTGGFSRFTSTNTLFYLNRGSANWFGAAILNMSAPTSGPYQGLIFYMPPENTSAFRIMGYGNTSLVGSIIAPGAALEFEGFEVTKGIDTQIIVDSITFMGMSSTTIQYDADQNYGVYTPPIIELAQ